MMHGERLLVWARGTYAAWWDTRHDTRRDLPEVMLARVYLQGGIDALKDETERKRAQASSLKEVGRESGHESHRRSE